MSNQTYTVTEITNAIKYMLEGQPTFRGFVLKGEISNFTRHHTGHLYFALKDEKSQIRAIMFAGNARGLTFDPKSGDKVVVTGSISVYGPQGSYSVQVTSMQAAGAGELHQKYLELKKTLETKGWFDKVKKEIPKFPKKIGVVTSSTGAVIQDITDTVNRRYRLTDIILYPALVQGTNSSQSVANQIKRANKENIVDVLIVGRGGGSIEDLWGFNEMPAIEAIYTSKIPVIAAIGHESDNTISDLVADLRAPTPTAAAELATPNTYDLVNNIKDMKASIAYRYNSLVSSHIANLVHLSERLEQSSPFVKIRNYKQTLNSYDRLLDSYIYSSLRSKENLLKQLELKLKNASPTIKLNENKNKVKQLKANLSKSYYYKVDNIKQRILNLESLIKSPIDLINNKYKETNKLLLDVNNSYQNIIENNQKTLQYNINVLEKVNPLNIMKRGFAIIKDDKGIVTSIDDIDINSNINVELTDGIIYTKVINKKEK